MVSGGRRSLFLSLRDQRAGREGAERAAARGSIPPEPDTDLTGLLVGVGYHLPAPQLAHPLQVFIRLRLEEFRDPEFIAGWNEVYASDSVIYALIVCSIIPILIIYPFIQKYFAKGVNVGGVKE